ncbi:hypothetical protein DND132_3055 [Pseudodesulfovibrio mercurii]|uniref:Uncharacterized protein n=1 Tax=Pseudodesulfovibrio mercurii TaxID=641491 RepID=F0JK09_9BACT|nr:hypothetical protein [Pseudodesulfovibrio mercurii]EGB16258.1 hypothetical protein DND132_3055 [Pseudodesulfovibrio mercurii]
MRMNNQHLPTGAAAGPMPFAGLGLNATEVRLAAETMAPVFRRSCAEPAVAETVRGPAVLSGGYKLLVALGREIRGR